MKMLTLILLSAFLFSLNARSESTDDLTALVEAALAKVDARASMPNGFSIPPNYFDYAKYNDLKDVRDNDSNANKAYSIEGTSGRILQAISENPSRFTQVEGLTFYLERDAHAPIGSIGDLNGRKEFVISSDRDERKQNVIYSVHYEKIREVTEEIYPNALELKNVYQADLLLFSHSDQIGGGFFTRVSVLIDWQKRDLPNEQLVSVISEPRITLLEDTDFKLEVDLSLQKAVLDDQNSDILLVFPITAGAVDNRATIDGEVNSMTLQVPAALRERGSTAELQREYQDFNLNSSVLVKHSVWKTRVNTDKRTYPSYYMGRPFLAIIDKNFVNFDDQGNISNFYDGYRHIGFHFKIRNELKRGYYSHGCLRTPDPALYTLNAILNLGPKDFIPVEVKMSQPEYESVDSLIPRITDSYKQTVFKPKYTSIDVNTVYCKPTTSYRVKEYVARNGLIYETIADGDCLTRVDLVQTPVSEINDFKTGRSSIAPISVILNPETLHTPIAERRQFLLEHYDQISRYRALYTPIEKDNYILDLSREKQLDKIELVNTINNPSEFLSSNEDLVVSGFPYERLDQVYSNTNYARRHLFPRDRNALEQNESFYLQYCAEKTNPSEQCDLVVRNLRILYGRMNVANEIRTNFQTR